MKPLVHIITGAAVATSLIFGGLALSEARAEEANWKDTEFWRVTGDSKGGWCRAEATFPTTGLVISMGLNNEGWKLMMVAPNTTPMETGKQYTVDVVLTNKMTARLTGVAFDPHGLAFSGLTPQFVMDFAYAPSIIVGDLGRFNLKGSLEAILETHACFKAVTGTAEAVTPTRRA